MSRKGIWMIAVLAAMAGAVFMGCGGEEPTAPATREGAAVSEGAARVYEGVATVGEVDVEQKTCPVMGGAIDKRFRAEYEGRTIYFCCASCLETFKGDPEKYITKVDEELATLRKRQARR